ncbi:MAG: radical SAM protein [Candidatus Diapherotrites archaeon]
MNSIIRNNYGLINHNIYKIKNKLSILDGPTYVQWLATHDCNYSCAHCGTSAGKALKDELTTNEIKKVIEDMGEMGVKLLSVTGGEPLLRKDLFEMLHLAKSKGMHVGFVTNGSLVSKYKKEIKELEPYSMMVSIDGIKETHNFLRGNEAHFDKSIEAVEFFNKINVPIVSIATTVNKKNLNELEELKKIVMTSGATHWRINIAIPEGRAKDKDWMQLNDDELRQLFEFIKKTKGEFNIEICEGAGYLGKLDKDLRKMPFFCGCGWNTFTIMANGYVMGCPIFENQEELSEGNVRQNSIKEIWENKFERFRNLQLDETCNSCNNVNACRGGCWMMRLFDAHCLKETWETY